MVMSATMTPDGREIADSEGRRIGLALSGRGVKAALVHLGVLARLAELDLLRRVDVISAVSGGTLTAALYHLHLKRALDAEGEIGTPGLIGLVAAVERHLLDVVQTDLRARLFASLPANLKRGRAGYSSASRLGDLLDRHLFRPVWNGDPKRPIELRMLAIRPRGDDDFNPIRENPKRHCRVPALVLHAADVDSGHLWQFDDDGMGEPVMRPAASHLIETPRLAKTAFRRLPDAHAGMTLGRAVAASMATPGLLEPLRLERLYPDPDQPASFRDLRLGDGSIADAFASDVLIERACSHCILVDGGGFDGGSRGRGITGMRVRQLDELMAARPGRVAFIHLGSELGRPDILPAGKAGGGQVVRDRMEDDVTSYGVERGLQARIAAMRADLDAPSEIESMTLMANGYLLAKRGFERLRLNGAAWPCDPPIDGGPWRFAPMFDALREPPNALRQHLDAACHQLFQGPRLAQGQTVTFWLGAIAFSLSLIALGAIWSSVRPATGEDGGWTMITGGVAALAIWLFGRRLLDAVRAGAKARLVRHAGAVVLALPLWLKAAFRRRASRAFLKVGRLRSIGVEPVTPATAPKRTVFRRREPARRETKKAA